MAQVLVTNEAAWYQGIASLKNISEKKLELRVLKYTQEVFRGYYGFQSSFKFKSKVSIDTAAPDLILIAKDFSQWIIVELELIGKPLIHTHKQLRVFSNPVYDIETLIVHCMGKDTGLVGKDSELRQLFTNHDPRLLVIFDTYEKATLDKIASMYTCKICVFEIYRTADHDLEVYRISGDYPYVDTGFSYLKNHPTNFDQYQIQRPGLFAGVAMGKLFIYHKMRVLEARLSAARTDYFLKIPDNPFPPGDSLKIFKALDGKFFIEKL